MINKALRECILATNNPNHEQVIERLSVIKNKELLHAALGMASELGEVLAAIKKDDVVNLMEELGDMLWYHGLAEITISPEVLEKELPSSLIITEVLPFNEAISLETTALVPDLVEHVSEFVDLVKKSVFYGKEIDSFQMELKLNKICSIIRRMAGFSGVSVDTVCNIVVNKLSKRYKSGFSDKNAIIRDLVIERSVMESQIEKSKK